MYDMVLDTEGKDGCFEKIFIIENGNESIFVEYHLYVLLVA